MELLPLDIKRIIIDILPIPDKRNLIRCCKSFNQLYYLMKSYEIEFEKLLNVTKFVSYNPRKFNQYELYALEYIYYDREDIPDKYLNHTHNKNLLTEHALLYFNMAMNQINVCKKIYIKYTVFIVSIMNGAASAGNLKMLKWARKNKETGYHKLNSNICKLAALNGHLEVLQWARKKRCTAWSTDTCSNAARNGHLEVLKWARENGYDWSSETCYFAICNGHLEVLKWALENGCLCDSYVFVYAAKKGQFEILKWARENGYKLDDSLICYEAEKNGHLEVLKWLS